MSEKNFTTAEIVKISNKMFQILAKELGGEEMFAKPADVVCVLAIMHRMAFACVEREKGIEKAREETGFMVELVETTLADGAWDEENGCLK